MRKLALLLTAVLLALLASEALVRLSGAAPEVGVIQAGRFRLSHNPRLGFEPVPGTLAPRGPLPIYYGYEGEANSLGFRDVEHAARKPHGVYRIVVLGDSVGSGLKVERLEDIFPRRLEALLRQAGLEAEVINLSVTGYNTQQEVAMLRKRGLDFSPDLVLVAYTLSDRERLDGNILETLLTQERLGAGHAVRHANTVLLRSALYRLTFFRLFASEPKADSPEVAERYERAVKAISGDTVEENFSLLRRVARRNHFEVLVAAFPYFIHLDQDYAYRAEHEFARREASRHGFRFLDLLEPLRHCHRFARQPLHLDSFHPNALGHRCAAQAMADEILTHPHQPVHFASSHSQPHG